MRPMVDRFVDAVAAVPRQPPHTPFISNVTGTWISDEQAQDPAYWGRQVLAPVEYAEGIRELAADPGRVFVELGPGQTLTSLARRTLAGGPARLVAATLPHRRDRRSSAEAVQRTLGQLWLAGVAPDWAGFYQHERRRRVPLPTYPFERREYRLPQRSEPVVGGRSARRRGDVGSWFQLPTWQRTAPPPAPVPAGNQHWLVFTDRLGLGDALAGRLRRDGVRVTTVAAGERWIADGDGVTIDPGDADHYRMLLRSVGAEQPVTRVAHCWNVTGETDRSAEHGTDAAGVSAALRLAFDSLLLLAQALNGNPGQPDCRIWVVTDGLYDVTGMERLTPLKATVLGPCRVIPREHPGLACRSVGVTLAGTPVERTVDHLLGSSLSHPVTRRWRTGAASLDAGVRPGTAPAARRCAGPASRRGLPDHRWYRRVGVDPGEAFLPTRTSVRVVVPAARTAGVGVASLARW